MPDKCDHCDGSGKCPGCDGKGYVADECPCCNNYGERVPCQGCNDPHAWNTEPGKCTECEGTGENVYG
jgi:hypothetical protein